ncbi:MAG: hypothetical protein Q9219_002464 [cf. Caloplaca sp. 3 TL-2023]
MAYFIDWIFPCFSIEPPEASKESEQQAGMQTSHGFKPGSNDAPSRVDTVSPMAYHRDASRLGARQAKSVDDSAGQGAGNPEVPGAINSMKVKSGRPRLTVSIPPSTSKPPIEKTLLFPDSARGNRHTLNVDRSSSEPEEEKGAGIVRAATSKKAVEKSPFSTSSSIASAGASAQTDPFETPAYVRWRAAQQNIIAGQTSQQANLKDELDNFSITSQAETLSAFEGRESAKSPRAVSALRSSELNTSVHDFAHEKHRDLAARLPSACLEHARRAVWPGEAGSDEPKLEVGVDKGRRLC